MKKRLLWGMCSLLSLTVGAVLYGLYRQDTYIGEWIGKIIRVSLPLDGWFSKLAAFYLPDYLWMFALTCALFAVILPEDKGLFVWCGIALALGALWELMQLWDAVSGTADIHDVILYSMAVISAAIISSLKKRRK